MQFTNGLKTPVEGLVNSSDGMDYLSWARALALSNRPKQEVVIFEERPYLSFFDGAVVAVDTFNSDETHGNRVWLPVMNELDQSIPEHEITPNDVNNAIQRCKTKAIALNTGVGMSLYAGFGDDIKGFLNYLDVTPETNLSHASVPFKELGVSPYVEWTSAYTSAQITDPDFLFSIESSNMDGRFLPYFKVGTGYSVAVSVCYKGQEHTEWLPIMDSQHRSIEMPDVFYWNTAIMRCLTKAIAVVSGYGLGIYAKEDLTSLLSRKPLKKKTKDIKVENDKELPDLSQEVNLLRAELKSSGISESDLLDFLNADTDKLEGLSPSLLKKGKIVVNSRPQ